MKALGHLTVLLAHACSSIDGSDFIIEFEEISFASVARDNLVCVKIQSAESERMRNITAIWSESEIAQYNGRRNSFASTRGRGERGASSTKEASVVWNLRNDVLKRKV
ncbi:hypothetical protein EVAR_32837_1 [Eumeta japonica]|uniref:Uncharacterized protein n=1 Tax=Eumeta variegata TaxID=151549 RepID=A0A4C1WE81_EUMVA|nr:hypothetical protein EVAR_32837_1 [Eumeta japonica]